MSKEYKVLIFSMINNLIISVLKIVGGVLFGLGSLFADGMHTFSDFITDIVCIVGSKISKKKPTKYHPFGFGKVEYLTNLYVGIILLALGIYLIVSSFFKESVVPPISLLWLLLVVFVLKLIAILVMHKVGEKINSQFLITSVEESKADLYSTIGVAIITVLVQFSGKYPILEFADLVGSILIGIIVLKTAFAVIVENSLLLIGEVENDPKEKEKIEEILKKYKNINKYDMEIIKYGDYYKLELNLEVNNKCSLRQVSNLENKLRNHILKHRSLKIRYVSIYVSNHL